MNTTQTNMSNQHPLTDEICCAIEEDLDLDWAMQDDEFMCMRAGADWQLDQVKEEVKHNLILWRMAGYDLAADACEDFFEKIMRAMRPATTQEDNS